MATACSGVIERATKVAAEMLAYLDFLVAEHDTAWEQELFSAAPRWPVMLGLHLRICELEHLQEAAGELL